MAKMGEALIYLILGLLCSLYYTFVTVKLWGWFAVPIGLPIISFWVMYGLGLLVRSVRGWGLKVRKESNDDFSGVAKIIGYTMVLYTGLLFLGWIIHKFFL